MRFHNHLSATFFLDGAPDDEQIEMVAELNAILEPMESQARLLQHERMSGETFYTLYVKLNPEAVSKHKTRGAGRRRNLVFKAGEAVTIGQVRKMMENGTAESVAAELGISRSTLFRRLKENIPDEFYF